MSVLPALAAWDQGKIHSVVSDYGARNSSEPTAALESVKLTAFKDVSK